MRAPAATGATQSTTHSVLLQSSSNGPTLPIASPPIDSTYAATSCASPTEEEPHWIIVKSPVALPAETHAPATSFRCATVIASNCPRMPITQTAVIPKRSLKSVANGSTAPALTDPLGWNGVKGAAITNQSGTCRSYRIVIRDVLICAHYA